MVVWSNNLLEFIIGGLASAVDLVFIHGDVLVHIFGLQELRTELSEVGLLL